MANWFSRLYQGIKNTAGKVTRCIKHAMNNCFSRLHKGIKKVARKVSRFMKNAMDVVTSFVRWNLYIIRVVSPIFMVFDMLLVLSPPVALAARLLLGVLVVVVAVAIEFMSLWWSQLITNSRLNQSLNEKVASLLIYYVMFLFYWLELNGMYPWLAMFCF